MLGSFLPLLWLHFRQLWAYQHYQFFPLVLCAVPPLLWLHVNPPTKAAVSGSKRLACFGSISLLLLAFATLFWSPNVAAVAAVVIIAAVLLELSKRGQLNRPLAFVLPLALLIKLPLNLDVDLTFRLQSLTSAIASRILDVVGINHVLHGHIIRTQADSFLVEEACSGIQSLFSLLAVTAVALIVIHRKPIQCLMLMMSAVFWAIALNVMRVTSVVIANSWFGLDIASGVSHQILGFTLFAVALAMQVSSDSLFAAIFGTPEARIPQPEIKEAAVNTPIIGIKSAIAFGILGVAQLTVLSLSSFGTDRIDPDDPEFAAALGRKVLPSEFNGWTLVAYQTESRTATNYMGRNSVQWVYGKGNVQAVIAIDYPFLGWHDLAHCYSAQGCSVGNSILLNSDTEGLHTVQCDVVSPGGLSGVLWYSQFRESGEPLLPPGNNASAMQYWQSRFETTVLRQMATFQTNPSNYQIQLLASPTQRLESEDLDLLSLFHQRSAKSLVAAIRRMNSQ